MELRHLRYFVAAVEEGSLQGAALRMNVAQPALSRRIRDLEETLGSALLERGPRGVVPTRAGAAFYRDALALLGGLDIARQRVRQTAREQEDVARLGLIQTARKYGFLHEAIAAFGGARPRAHIAYRRASSADLATALREGDLDATLLYERRAEAPGLRERLVHHELYVLAAHPAHPLAQGDALSLSRLAGEPLVWLSRADDPDHHDLLLQQCRLHGIDPVIAHMAHSHEEQMDLAAVSGGAFLTPASTLFSTPPAMLVFRALPHFDMEISLSLAWRESAEGGATGAMIALLHESIDRHQAAIAASGAALARLEGMAVLRAPHGQG